MAYRIPNGAGTAFNTAANWDQGTNTPSIHASTNITVTSGGVSSAGFTAPDLVTAATGVVLPFASVGTAGTLTYKLQLAGADVAGATGTVAVTSLFASSKIHLRFGTPVVFTSLVANTYTIRLSIAGGSGTTSVCADSGGANFSYVATDDRHVVPGAGDDIIGSGPNLTPLVMALDVSPSIGSGTNTSVAAFRSYGNAIDLSSYLCLAWSITTSYTVTCKGNFLLQTKDGELRMGTTSGQVPLTVSAHLKFDQNGTTTNYGLVKLTGGKVTIQGTPLTYKKTTIVSGVGTAASPIVFSDSVDWTVGDELVFAPGTDSATNYNETEVRFIKTKNSATSYVISSTSGGAEAALTYTHAFNSAPVFNVTRPCLIDTTDITKAWYGNFIEGASAAQMDIDGVRFETTGGTTASKTNINFATVNGRYGTIDDIVLYRSLGTSGVQLSNDRNTQSYSWWISYLSSAIGNSAAIYIPASGKTWSDCHAIASQGAGIIGGGSSKFYRCGVWGSGIASSTGISGFYFSNTAVTLLSDCDSHASRAYSTYLSGGSYVTFVNSRFGTKGTSKVADIFCLDDTTDNFLFDQCLFGSATLISNYLMMNNGSKIAFNKFNQVANTHKWYLPEGIAQSTGAALSDTTVHTAGSLALRIAPEDSSTGFIWDFKVLARVGTACQILGFLKKNAAFGTDVVTVELYLPGLTPGVDTPSDTQTMPDDTVWNVFALAASYTGTEELYATVRVIAKTTTASAYIYIDDLYNGTNPITAMDVWDRGEPSPIMYAELGDAAAVWTVLTSTFTVTGTVGYLVTKLLTVAKFLGLK